MKRVFYILILLCVACSPSIAADYYWVGGSGNWNELNHWSTTSGGSVHPAILPDSTDNVFFDVNSFDAGGQRVSLSGSAICSQMNWTGVTNYPTFENTSSLSIYGDLILVKGMKITRSGSWSFKSGAGVNLVTTSAKFLVHVEIAGNVQLRDDLNAQSLTIVSGIFNTNNAVINSFEFNLVPASSSCIVKMGASIINCYFYIDNGVAILDAGTSAINTQVFTSQNHNYYNVALFGDWPSFAVSGNAFNTLSINTAGTTNISPSVGGVSQGPLTITNEFIINGPAKTIRIDPAVPINLVGSLIVNSSATDRINIEGTLLSPQASINKPSGTICISDISLRNLAINGAGPFYVSNSVNYGNNSGWTFTSQSCQSLQPGGFYWTGGTGNWNDLNHWATTSGGATHPATLPGSNDDVFFDANSFTGSGQIVSLTDNARCRSIDWTGATFNPTLEFAGSGKRQLNISGSLTLIPGMSISYPFLSGNWQFITTSNASQTITSAGKYLSWVSLMGNVQLQDNLDAGNIYLWSGTWNTNSFSINADTISTMNIFQCTLTLGSSQINCTHWFYDDQWLYSTIINQGSSVITSHSFVSQFAIYNDVIISGDAPQFEVSGGGFHNLTINTISNTAVSLYSNSKIVSPASISVDNLIVNGPAKTVYLDPSVPIYLQSFTVNPNPGDIIGISGLYSNSQSTIHSGQIICLSNVALSNLNAAGGGTFYASNSIDNGNNTGWTFTNQSCAAIPSINCYWVGGSGNWSDLNHWATTSGGSVHLSSLPDANDNVFFDNNSFDAAGQVVSLNTNASFMAMNWTGVSNNPTLEFSGGATVHAYGDLTLVTDMTMNYITGGNWLFTSTAAGNTITTAGKQMGGVTFSGNWTLQDNLNAATITISPATTFNTNNATINANIFTAAGPDCGGSTIYLGSSVINCSQWNMVCDAGMTLDPGTSVINTSFLFMSSRQHYHSVSVSGPGFQVSNDVFDRLTLPAISIWGTAPDHFTQGPLIVRNNLTINGSVSIHPDVTVILLDSLVVNSSPGNVFTLQGIFFSPRAIIQSSKLVCISNVAISNINATGAPFYASNSIDNGNNSGWTFTTQSCAFILPVELTSFESACVSDRLNFTWRTASEINSSHFNLQKYSDAGWVTIGTVKASGESQSEHIYQFHSEEYDGIFRLACVDRDGKIVYSLNIDAKCEDPKRMRITPNPVERELKLEIRSIKNESTRLQIVNSLGVIVRDEQVKLVRGTNYFKFDLHTLPSGIYMIFDSAGSTSMPFIKVR